MITSLRSFPEKFRRITTSGNYRAEIDGLRFFAIAMVIVAHLWTRAGRLHDRAHEISSFQQSLLKTLDSGQQGVLLFFTISGFIISSQWLRHKPNIRAYFVRRVTRIEPPYLITITVIYLLAISTGYRPDFANRFNNTDIGLTESFLASLVYLHGILFNAYARLLPPAWSLEIEIQFYIIAPLLFFAYYCLPSRHRIGILVLVAGIAISLASDSLFGHGPQRLTIIHYFPYFWLGVLLSDVYGRDRNQHYRFDLIAGSSLIVLALASNELARVTATPAWVLFGVRIAAIYGLFAGAIRGVHFRSLCRTPWIALAGGACYSLYLTHLPVAAVATSLMGKLPVPANLAATYTLVLAVEVPLIFCAGLIFYLIIERPFMRPHWPAELVRWVRTTASRVSMFGRRPARSAQASGTTPAERPVQD